MFKINPSFIQCECGLHVFIVNPAGDFTCTNPTCKNFEKMFRAPDVVAKPIGKSYRETMVPESSMPKAEVLSPVESKPAADRRRR